MVYKFFDDMGFLCQLVSYFTAIQLLQSHDQRLHNENLSPILNMWRCMVKWLRLLSRRPRDLSMTFCQTRGRNLHSPTGWWVPAVARLNWSQRGKQCCNKIVSCNSFGHQQITTVTHSLHVRCQLVCKSSPATLWATVWCTPETENVCLQSKCYTFEIY